MPVSAIDSSSPIRFTKLQVGLAAFIATIVFAAMFKFGMTALIAAALLGTVLIVAAAQPDAATLVVLFVMYSNAAAVAVRSHGVPSAFATGFFFLLFIPIVSYVVFKKQPIRVDLVLGLMVAFIGAQLASALFSPYTADTYEFITKYIFEGVVIYFLIINTVRSATVLRRSLWVILAAGGLLATISAVQELTHTYDNEYGGFALTKIVNARGYLDEANTDTGETDSMGRAVSRPRAGGPIGDPNFYGQILCSVLPISVVLLFSYRKRWLQLLAHAICSLLIFAILLTFSRGTALAVVVLVVFLVLLRYLKIRHVLVASLLIAFVIAVNPAYRNRMDTFSFLQKHGMRTADYSVRERATILLASVHIFMDYPMFGVGPGQSPKFIASYGNSQGYTKVRKEMEAHNTYLQQLDETGLIGFLCLGSIVAVTLRNLMHVRSRWKFERPEYAHVATALMLAIAMFLTTSLFLHLAFMRYFCLLLGLSGAAVLIYKAEAEEQEVLPPPQAVRQRSVPTW
jgi:putative inorganic carbon (HCO3(-)) transporter